MPSNFSIFKFVTVKSTRLIFAFSVPLSIEWRLSKFSLSLFSLYQLKSEIDSSSSDFVKEFVCILVGSVRNIFTCITCNVSFVRN